MKISIVLSLILISFSFQLSDIEKDKYLACSEIKDAKMKKDLKTIDEILKAKPEMIEKGLKRLLGFDLILKCLDIIDDAKAQTIYKNLVKVKKEIQIEDYDFEFDYSPLKTQNEVIYLPKYVKVMKTIKALTEEVKNKNSNDKNDL